MKSDLIFKVIRFDRFLVPSNFFIFKYLINLSYMVSYTPNLVAYMTTKNYLIMHEYLISCIISRLTIARNKKHMLILSAQTIIASSHAAQN